MKLFSRLRPESYYRFFVYLFILPRLKILDFITDKLWYSDELPRFLHDFSIFAYIESDYLHDMVAQFGLDLKKG